MGFKSGDDPVTPDDFNDVMELLQGPSRWQQFISKNISQLKVTKDTFQLDRNVSNPNGSTDFKIDAAAHGLGVVNDQVMGFTDKAKSKIIMKEFQANTRSSYLLAVLHECVHLVSDPPSGGGAESTARQYLGRGLEEALVELVAEDVLAAHNPRIPLPKDRDKLTFTKQLGVLGALMAKQPSINLWGCLLFNGDKGLPSQLSQAYNGRSRQANGQLSQYTYWERIKLLTTGIENPGPVKDPDQVATKIINTQWNAKPTTAAKQATAR